VSDVSAQRSSRPHVAIVGGGIAGLSAAVALQELAAQEQLDLTCTVFEAETSWGGKILTHRVKDFIIEAGPDSFLSQKPWALELCAKLGLANRLVNTNEESKKTFVYSRGALRQLPEGLEMMVPTKLGAYVQSGLLSWRRFSRMVMEMVMTGRMDMALIYDPGPLRGVQFEPVFSEDLFLVAPTGRAALEQDEETVGLQALRDVELLLPSRIHTIRKVV
jgi:monoamine oxidase